MSSPTVDGITGFPHVVEENYAYTYHSKLIKDLNLSPEIQELVEYDIVCTLCDKNIRQNFLKKTPFPQEVRTTVVN